MPVLCVQIYKEVLTFRGIHEVHINQCRTTAAAVANSLAIELAGIESQQRRWASCIALEPWSDKSIDDICETANRLFGDSCQVKFARATPCDHILLPGAVGKTRVSQLELDQDGSPCVTISTPLETITGNNGSLTGRIQLSFISDQLRSAGTNNQAMCSLVTGGGALVVDSAGAKWIRRIDSAFLRQHTAGSAAECPICKTIGFGAVCPIKNTDWAVYVSNPAISALDIDSRQKKMLLWSLLAALVGLSIMFLLGNRLTSPVRRLAFAASAIAVGDYRKRVNIRTGDELEQLANSFNALGESLSEHEGAIKQQAAVLARMVEATRIVSTSLDLSKCGEAVAKAVCTHFGAQGAAVFRGKPGSNLAIAGCYGQEPNDSWERLASHAAESGEYLLLTEDQSQTLMAGIPLMVGRDPLGAIVAKYERTASAKDLRIGGLRADALTAFGIHAAAILKNASLYTREYSIAETLQAGLLPDIPEQCEGLKFASRYIPALDEARIGGDFYHVLRLPNKKVGVVIADVSGKGLSAAIHLAACKYMMKALMFEHPDDPGEVLRELNRAMNYYYDLSFFVTIFYGVIDPNRYLLTYASAGHPPGILITRNGEMHCDLFGTGTPAGSGQDCNYGTRKVTVSPSDILLLYTDGVTDTVVNGGLLQTEGLHKIIFEAGKCTATGLVDYVCDRLSSKAGSFQRDDTALLAISFEDVATVPATVIGGSGGREHSIFVERA